MKKFNLNPLPYEPNNLMNQKTKESTCVNCKANVSSLLLYPLILFQKFNNITTFQAQLGSLQDYPIEKW